MELRSRPGISGSQTRQRATSEGRKADTNRIIQADNVNSMKNVNSPSSAIGIARGGKTPSRILPVEDDQLRAVGPQPRNGVVRVRGELPRRPEGTRLVADGKFGKAATWAGEVRQVVNSS